MADLWGIWLTYQEDWMRTLQGDYIQVYDDRHRAEDIVRNYPNCVGLEAQVRRLSASPPLPARRSPWGGPGVATLRLATAAGKKIPVGIPADLTPNGAPGRPTA